MAPLYLDHIGRGMLKKGRGRGYLFFESKKFAQSLPFGSICFSFLPSVMHACGISRSEFFPKQWIHRHNNRASPFFLFFGFQNSFAKHIHICISWFFDCLFRRIEKGRVARNCYQKQCETAISSVARSAVMSNTCPMSVSSWPQV